MACETAVVASAVGGIKEVVVDGETGFLVPLEQMKESPFEPVHPDKFSGDFAEKVNRLMRDERLRQKFGEAGRKRAIEKFSWSTIAARQRECTSRCSSEFEGTSSRNATLKAVSTISSIRSEFMPRQAMVETGVSVSAGKSLCQKADRMAGMAETEATSFFGGTCIPTIWWIFIISRC